MNLRGIIQIENLKKVPLFLIIFVGVILWSSLIYVLMVGSYIRKVENERKNVVDSYEKLSLTIINGGSTKEINQANFEFGEKVNSFDALTKNTKFPFISDDYENLNMEYDSKLTELNILLNDFDDKSSSAKNKEILNKFNIIIDELNNLERKYGEVKILDV